MHLLDRSYTSGTPFGISISWIRKRQTPSDAYLTATPKNVAECSSKRSWSNYGSLLLPSTMFFALAKTPAVVMTKPTRSEK